LAIAASDGVVLLPFTDREPYGSPYPEGLAVSHIDVTGDASGGGITAAVLADGGFLFRVEAINATVDSETTDDLTLITVHRLLTDRSGLGQSAFSLNWHMTQQKLQGFSVWGLHGDRPALVRLPIGRTDIVSLQTIFTWVMETNVDGDIYDFDLIMTYWRVTSLYRPGMLHSFWESPIVPTVEGRATG